MAERRGAFLSGLFLTALGTLTLEILDTRLLSVVTWYHLSFFAVSTAMLGMSAGAVRVYLGGEAFSGNAAPRELARTSLRFALAVPLCGVINLCIPIPAGAGVATIATTAASALILAIPFYLSGIVIAIALTRIPGPSGRTYAVDLLGAALGSASILAVFQLSSIASGMLALGGLAALASGCFHHFAERSTRPAIALGALWFALMIANELAGGALGVIYAKGKFQDPTTIDFESWTIHGHVVARESRVGAPFLWGQTPRDARLGRVEYRNLKIDGAALTVMTLWDGDPGKLRWIQHDVTSLPYHLRKGGDAAVVGVGGGRDLLNALWGDSRSVVGVEINEGLLELLTGPLRGYARLADHPRVTLVHDEARSFLTRTDQRFDTLQMSLIDTWAATGAGAFTLSENGLYTVEAWRSFLDTLRPGGILSVSRFYSPTHASETSRLVALAAATLLDAGATDPSQQLILAGAGRVATLVLSTAPFTPADLTALRAAAERFQFEILLAPGTPPADPMLAAIVASRSPADIAAAVDDERFDYSPPTDERPYFFNILRPSALLGESWGSESKGVVARGNLLATSTLGTLWVITLVLTLTTILGPLSLSGLPKMRAQTFGLALFYFAAIGTGFMLVQIPLMQRFSVYLGHPTYSVAVILFSNILAAGVGSLLSDRIDLDRMGRGLVLLPIGIAVNLLGWTLGLQPIIDATIQFDLPGRVAVVSGVVAAAALPLGMCFPIGLRLVQRISDDAAPWLWGVNGAAGVLASVSAVGISMWGGISVSLYLAAATYGLLALAVAGLQRAATTPR